MHSSQPQQLRLRPGGGGGGGLPGCQDGWGREQRSWGQQRMGALCCYPPTQGRMNTALSASAPPWGPGSGDQQRPGLGVLRGRTGCFLASVNPGVDAQSLPSSVPGVSGWGARAEEGKRVRVDPQVQSSSVGECDSFQTETAVAIGGPERGGPAWGDPGEVAVRLLGLRAGPAAHEGPAGNRSPV